MTKLEVLQKQNPLFHTSVPIHFKQGASKRISRVDVSNNVLRDHIQSWCLLGNKIKEKISATHMIIVNARDNYIKLLPVIFGSSIYIRNSTYTFESLQIQPSMFSLVSGAMTNSVQLHQYNC